MYTDALLAAAQSVGGKVVLMPKHKTHKGLAKRVRITGRGKVSRWHSGGSHLMSGKNAKRRRRLARRGLVKGPAAKCVKRELGR